MKVFSVKMQRVARTEELKYSMSFRHTSDSVWLYQNSCGYISIFNSKTTL